MRSSLKLGLSVELFAILFCCSVCMVGQAQAGSLKNRPPRFEDLPVKNIYTQRSRPVDLRSNPEAREYRTRLRGAAKGKPNFAGHYIVSSWGCGSNCQEFKLIDARSGKVYNGPTTDRGADFRVDSALFIADPPYSAETVAHADDTSCIVPIRYFVWRKNQLVLIYEQACTVVNHRQKCGPGTDTE